MKMSTTYYVIETEYVGPNQDDDRYCDADRVVIQIVPGITNSSHEPRIEGWLGTTNDWSATAHGAYGNIEAARAAITERFGPCREVESDEYNDTIVVEAYKIGRFEQLGRESTCNWIYEGMRIDIDADTTDARLAELLAEYEGAANAEGYTLDERAAEKSMREYRDKLRAERDDD